MRELDAAEPATETGREVVELEVESIAGGGDGVAREPSGRVVFLPRTAPGDRVSVRITEERRSYARGRVERLLSPGSGRAEAPCSHYADCGGCQLQHLGVAAELEAKRGIVADALQRIGGVEVEVPLPVRAGPRLGYRNRVTFTLRRTSEGIVAGYHRLDRPAELVDVAECPLAEAPVTEAWRALRGAWGEGARRLPSGGELRISLRASALGGVGLVVETADAGRDRGGAGAAAKGDPAAIERAVSGSGGGLLTYHWRDASGRRRRLGGADRFRERWEGVELELGPESFLQVNRAVSAAMDRHLAERAGDVAGRRVLELYGGIGVRALGWARRGAEVVCCDADPEAVESGRRAASAAGLPVDFRSGRVEDLLPGLLPAALAILNPPRSGLGREVTRVLSEGGAERLAYVSCDPATLARDLARLDGWRVAEVRPFDAFPQTAHVETIAWLER